MISLSNDDYVLFDQISNEVVTSYILDFITNEYEAIIHCPPSRHHRNITDTIVEDYFSNKKKKDAHFNDKSRSNFDHSGLPSPPLSASPERKSYKTNLDYPPTPPDAPMSLRSYIEAVVKKSRISTGTLLASLAYARRLKLKLSRTSKGMECTHHRIFLATLIISCKYIHDSAIKNKYWVFYALQLFSASEINLMEKQLLQLLDYQLQISPAEFNLIVHDIVKLYTKYHKQHLLEQLDWYPSQQDYSYVSVDLDKSSVV